MAKVPQDPKEIFPELTADYKEIYGKDLISILLYGSGASGDYIPKKSDLNFLITLSEEGIGDLNRALKTVSKWQKRKVATPLFLTTSYIESSLDSFPIEFFNIKRNYVLVYGEDVLKDLSFDENFVRLQCERELKGKLLQLREMFLESGGKEDRLKLLISQSLTAFISVFSAILYLRGKETSGNKRTVISLVSDELGLDKNLLTQLLSIKEGKEKVSKGMVHILFGRYLAEVRKLAFLVDEWKS